MRLEDIAINFQRSVLAKSIETGNIDYRNVDGKKLIEELPLERSLAYNALRKELIDILSYTAPEIAADKISKAFARYANKIGYVGENS